MSNKKVKANYVKKSKRKHRKEVKNLLTKAKALMIEDYWEHEDGLLQNQCNVGAALIERAWEAYSNEDPLPD